MRPTSFIKGTQLLRPRSSNRGNPATILAYRQALAGQTNRLSPLVQALGPAAPLGQLIFNQFAPSGPNFALAAQLGISEAQTRALATAFNLPQINGAFVPFSEVTSYESAGNPTYHGLTLTSSRRFSQSYQFFALYTYSHAIDDSTDVQALQVPQNNLRPDLERSNSNFDQRHRFVFSGVLQSPFKRQGGRLQYVLADWVIAPIIELSSGRPYNVITLLDQTNGAGRAETSRPNVVPVGMPNSFLAPNGRIALAIPPDGSFGNLGRNAFTTSKFISVDLRVSRKLYILASDRRNLELIVEGFNLLNRSNVSEVSANFVNAGTTTNAFPARQLQFAVKVNF